MIDVFISYSRSPRSVVEPIKYKLDALGLSCFFDMHQIDGGAVFPDVIDKALRNSKVVLCCWSPEYFGGQWSMIECRDAIARGIIVPVAIKRFEQFAPPADLRQINWFDLVDWNGDDNHEEWVRTLRNLSRFVGRDLVAAIETQADAGWTDSADPLVELRATWAAFPARNNARAVERFLERVRSKAAGSGFEIEIEHHLDTLRQNAERRAERQARAEAERREREAEEEAARIRAEAARREASAVWRDTIPGLADTALPEMVTIDPDANQARDCNDGEIPGDLYALGRRPVSYAEIDAAIAVGADLGWPSDQGKGRGGQPVLNVSRRDASAYADWLNSRLGLTEQADGYRLPTAAELAHASSTGMIEQGDGEADAPTALPEWCEDCSVGAPAQGSSIAFRLARTLARQTRERM